MIQNNARQQAEKEKQNNILNQEANKTKRKTITWNRNDKQEGRKKEHNKRETKKEIGDKGGGGQNG